MHPGFAAGARGPRKLGSRAAAQLHLGDARGPLPDRPHPAPAPPPQVVCQGTVASDERIRIQSFTCLHEIAANYYSRLPPYMTEIFQLTVKAIQGDTEEVALQAVEFWSTLCDYELELREDDASSGEVCSPG